MRLEDAPQIFVGIIFAGIQCCFDLRRVVGIVINDRKALAGPLIFKSPLGAGEGQESGFYSIYGEPEEISNGCSRQRIINIMQAVYV